MKIHMTSVFALAATVLLCTTPAQAGAHKALGGLAGGANNIGKALDGINLQGALDNLAPTPGAVPNVRGVPNIGNAVPSGQGLPNINSAVPSGQALPNINNAAPSGQQFGIYAAPPAAPNIQRAGPANNQYGPGPAPRQNAGIYDGVDTPLYGAPTNNVYDRVQVPNDTYTLAPTPARIGDPDYVPLSALPERAPGFGNAADLPTPPTNIPGRTAGNVPAANPGFFKRNKKALVGAAAGLGLAGAGVGGYYIAEDVAKDQNDDPTDESKITNAYEDSKEWTEGAVQTVKDWF